MMKKLLTLLIVLICSIGAISAQDWQTSKGYRGFADIGGIIGTGSHGENAFTISTTHGYQLMPSYLFVGAGVGFNAGSVLMPIYADIRSQLPTGKFSPFVDFRAGYSGKLEWSFNDGGAYINPSVGITWTLSKKIGLELAVGYTYQKATTFKVETGEFINGEWIMHTDVKERKNIGGINIRFGVSF